MRLGIGSYTYTWAIGVPGHQPDKRLSLPGLLDKAVNLGFSVLQIADNLPLHQVSEEELNNLVATSAKHQITLEVGARGLNAEHLARYINIAVKCHAPILRFVIDGKDYEPDEATIIAIIKDHVHALEKYGIKLALENHDRFKAKTFARIVEKVGSPWIGICLDTANSLGYGEGFDQVLEVLAPLTINLHIKDYTVSRLHHMMGFLVEGTPAGKGMLPIPQLLDVVGAHGRCESAILELWTPPEKHLDDSIAKENRWALESIDYLNQFFPS